MKKKLSTKILYNIITIVCVVSYIFSFWSIYLTLNNNEKNYQKLYASLLKEAGYFNSQVAIGQTNVGLEKETPKFYSAKSAVDYAYKSVFENSSYELFATGTMNITASVGPISIPINLVINFSQVKFDNNDAYTCFLRYDESTSNNQTSGTQRFYTNGKVYKSECEKTSVSLNKTTGIISAAFNNNYVYERDNILYTFIFDSNTIIKEDYFSVNYNPYTGKIESYSASVTLDTAKSVKGYDKQLEKEGYFASTPIFSKLKAHCVINADGSLEMATIEQIFTSSQSGGINIYCDSVLKIKVLSFGKTPTIQKPII